VFNAPLPEEYFIIEMYLTGAQIRYIIRAALFNLEEIL
jgi:hypothetical protein